jgi:hypothetical protein
VNIRLYAIFTSISTYVKVYCPDGSFVTERYPVFTCEFSLVMEVLVSRVVHASLNFPLAFIGRRFDDIFPTHATK